MARRKLTAKEIENLGAEVPQWRVEGEALYRELVFSDFVEAFGFMTKVALLAQAMNHHPDWNNVYKTVRIRLSTHDVGGLSELDFQLAEKIDDLVQTFTDSAP